MQTTDQYRECLVRSCHDIGNQVISCAQIDDAGTVCDRHVLEVRRNGYTVGKVATR